MYWMSRGYLAITKSLFFMILSAMKVSFLEFCEGLEWGEGSTGLEMERIWKNFIVFLGVWAVFVSGLFCAECIAGVRDIIDNLVFNAGLGFSQQKGIK